MWVYEEADEETEDNLYVHHDVIVPYFPLSVAWLDIDPTGEQLRSMRAACILMCNQVCESSSDEWCLDGISDAVL